MSIADEIKQKLESKQGRTDLFNKISDLAFLGPVGELTKSLEKKGEKEDARKAMELENAATYLLILAKLAIGKIRKFEGD